MVITRFQRILTIPPGPERTAAVVEWLQQQYEVEGREPPVLVGGAAVELFSGGAYTTGDLDFVGRSPDGGVRQRLREAGFERRGRHWIHEAAEIFIEFSGDTLDPGDSVEELQIGKHRLKILAPEAVLVDRLAAWQHWESAIDGAAVWLMYRSVKARLDRDELKAKATRREVLEALSRLERFARSLGDRDPTPEELESRSKETPS